MTVDALVPEAPPTHSDTPDALVRSLESTSPGYPASPEAPEHRLPPRQSQRRRSARSQTVNLTLTVTGTADGDWRAELKQGSTYLTATSRSRLRPISRAAKELHEELSTPIDEIIDEARSQQAARVAALENELEAARKALADLD